MFASTDDGVEQILEGLNDEQQAAVTHEAGPLLVLAGAGTGKTTTLCARVAWLITRGVPTERILLLTFTRRAAREMLARVQTRIPASAHRTILGGTFHSTAHRLISVHAAALGLPPKFGVLDASDAADLIDLLREEQGLANGERRFPRKGTLLDIYSRCVNAQRPLSEILSDAFPWCEEHLDKLAGLFRSYGERKRLLAVLDLDDLLLYWHALARDPIVGPRMAGMFDQLLVDEYQDLNALQVEIVRKLRSQQRGLTVVGDDAQAIYGFRAASAEHILNFPAHFPDATMITLERNYRSTQPILDLANNVAAQATRAYPKRLWAVREGDTLPQLIYCLDQNQQATAVCDRLLAEHERGTALKQQAVLMRAGHHSDLLELELSRRRIPFIKYGGIRYLEAAHVKDFICLLRIADNPADQLSWFRILRLLEGVGPVTARKALDTLDPANLDDLAHLPSRWESVAPLLQAPSRKAAAPIIGTLALCNHEQHANAVVDHLRDAIAPLIRAHYPDGPVRLRDLDQLAAAAAQASSLDSFLADIALDPPSSTADYAGPPQLDDDYLVLSTVHSAKGLEWDVVHVIAASDGNFPSDMALSTPEGLEEERRLFYVALTRSCRLLTIYVPLRYYHRPNARDDSHGYGKQSRFLTPEAEELCQRSDAYALEAQHWADNNESAPVRVEIDLADLWR
jgi:DNA helicase-2/ATP-dependent DNA helicase PcrA